MNTILRYGASGSVAAAAHLLVLWLLVDSFAIYPTYASAVGFCVATVVNYSLQYYWTFRVKGPHLLYFTRYVFVTTAMLGVNTGLFWTFNEFAALPYLVAQIAATSCVVVFNFTLNQRYTFIEPPAR